MRALGSSGEYSEQPKPVVQTPHDVLIQVAYADLNPVDLQKKPLVATGFSGSGFVREVGSASTLAVGSRVAFLTNRGGAYAEWIVVDDRGVVELVDSVDLRSAAAAPLAGCTAYEALEKMQIRQRSSLLIVGGAGGVGSWATLLARSWNPSLEIVCTTSKDDGWCEAQGASRTIRHKEIESLGGGREGSMDAILCLVEPEPDVFDSLTEVIRPFGCICLVVAGYSMSSLDLDFAFFKSATIATETVFSRFRTQFANGDSRQMLTELLQLPAPLSPTLNGDEDWSDAVKDGGILEQLASGHTRGKLVMRIASLDG